MSQGTMMRRVRVLALVLVLGLVPTLVAGVMLERADRASEQKALDRSLNQVAGDESTRLTTYFEEARKQLLLGSQNVAWSSFLAAPGDRLTKLRAGGDLVTRIDDGLAYFERL